MEVKVKNKGLSQSEVEQRRQRGEGNKSLPPMTRSFKRIFFENICTLFNLINLIIAGFIVYTGSYKNLLFLGVIITNTVIGIVQEIRAKHNIDKLSLLNQAKVQVIRDGVQIQVGQSELVKDDLMLIRRGEQLCVDGIVINTEGLELDESQLTGESDPVYKTVGSEVLSGSYVVSGNAHVQATKVGTESYSAKIALEAKTGKAIYSELVRTLRKIIKGLTFAIIPIGGLLFFSNYMGGTATLKQTILGTSAAIIGMIPEGLILITSIALAVGVINLTKRNVLVKTMGSIETLARVDLLCLDKTGTITDGNLKVKEIMPYGAIKKAQLEEVISALVEGLQDDNSTSLALKQAVTNNFQWNLTRAVPFSSIRKWSGATFENQGSYMMGAPEYLFTELPSEVQQKINQASLDGERILVFAKSSEEVSSQGVPADLTFIGLVIMEDTIRPEAPATLAYFAQQGVEVRIISGDNPQTVSHIAQRAGVKDGERFIDMSKLVAGEDLTEIAQKYTVFGRVSPVQKRELIQAMKKAGHTVGMTGDGVNDILALKEADCSIAMAEGSDAAKGVSDFVLLDSNFDSMVGVVMEGRRVVNNIQRVASLYLTKTVYSAILAAIFIFVQTAYPFEPIQLSPISSLTVGIPSFFLALRPNYSQIKGGFLKNVLKPAFSAGLTVVIYTLIILGLARWFNLDFSISSTLSVLLAGTVCFIALSYVSRPFDRKIMVMIGSLVTLFLIAFIFFGNLFSLVSLFNPQILLFGLPLIVTVPFIYHGMRILVTRIADGKFN
ncbi:cation-translocating P-type ATPase [Carnobacterium gallinarum]|uniref:cation-translocating P-type ATPase n=1 Tax=Carnobacterium gallinarum TaxID=2749 RepID=UPI000557E388|nr:cation-translocating P-type ATPase [Carnobacterium gallinarum]